MTSLRKPTSDGGSSNLSSGLSTSSCFPRNRLEPYSFVFRKPGGDGTIGLIQLLSQYLERCVGFSGQPERAADDGTRCFPFSSGQESCLRIGIAPTWLDEDIAASNRRPEQIERTEREGPRVACAVLKYDVTLPSLSYVAAGGSSSGRSRSHCNASNKGRAATLPSNRTTRNSVGRNRLTVAYFALSSP